jgi:tetratricopeptide (TPR) repeat protein
MRRFAASLLLPILVCAGAILPEEKLHRWVQVDTPNFRIISDSETSEAREVAYGFEQARAVLHLLIAGPRPVSGRPIIVLLAKDEAMVRDIWPEKVRMQDYSSGVLPVLGAEKCYFLIRTSIQELNRIQVFRGEVVLPLSHRAPFRAYAEIFVPLNYGPLPLWLETGLQAFYSNSERLHDQFRIGGPPPGGLRQSTWAFLPIETVLRADSQSPLVHDSETARVFANESWALVHYMRNSLDTAQPNSLVKVIDQLRMGADVRDAFQQYVGDPQHLDERLVPYLQRQGATSLAMAVPPRVKLKEIPVRALAPAEMEVVLGDFYLQGGWREAARQRITAALQMMPELPAALESLAWLEHLEGNDQAARERLQQVLRLNPESYTAHYYYGAVLAAAVKDGKELAQSTAELRRVIALHPDFSPTYHLLAGLQLKTGRNLNEAYQNAQRAIQLDFGVPEYYLTLAEILLGGGRADLALPNAKLAQMAARKKELRDSAAAFLEKLPKPREIVTQDAPAVRPSAPPEESPFRPQLRRRPASERSAIAAAIARDLSQRTGVGRIADVRCHAFALDLTLAQTNSILRLHTDNLVELIYLPDQNRPWDFDPCKRLAERQARVTYTPRAGKAYDGEISSIQLLK